MSKHIILTAIICVLIIGPFSARAEKATELYIPIGKSPGLSGKSTAEGHIEQVDYQKNTLTMSSGSHSYPVKVTEGTKIFLDRSKLGKPNQYGSFEDCKKGMMIEVRFEKDEFGQPADWIKLEMSQ